ncbi:type IX secretion system protein PorG [Spirosoma migulaei]
MHRYRMNIARLIVAGLFISLSTQAQKIELGATLGGMLCKGDVNPALNPRLISPAIGGFFRYNATRSFSMRAGGSIGSFRGEDRFSSDPLQLARDYSYKTSIQELYIDFEYNFLNYKPLPKAKNWTPYIFGGIGLCRFNNDVIRAGGVVTYPLGIGVKYEIKRPWSVGLEFGTRFTRNDYLDGLGDLTFGKAVTKTSQGNPALSDSYTYAALTVSYTFYKIVCP